MQLDSTCFRALIVLRFLKDYSHRPKANVKMTPILLLMSAAAGNNGNSECTNVRV